jgi:hypothetical protein
MSTESELNQPSASVETAAPTADYTPMADPVAAEEPKRKVYDGNDAETIREAAADLDKARAENRIPRADDEPVDRSYVHYTGEKAGERVAPNETLTADRAARDIETIRQWEAASQQPQPADEAAAVDALRAQYGQQQAEAPSELNDQARAHMAAEEPQQQPDGIHPDVRAALENEHVREALAREVASVEAARQQYAQGARQAAQVAGAALLSSFPELARVPVDQLQTAIAAVAQVNPQRAQQMTAQLEQTQRLYGAMEQAVAAEQQIQGQRFQEYSKAQDARFEASIANESAETRRAVIDNGARILQQHYGIDAKAFAQAVQHTPALRSAEVQRMLFDLIKTKVAQEGIAEKRDRSAPPVQRPGVSQPRGADSGVEAAMRAFRQNPGPKTGAALLQARRNSR